MRTAYVIVRFRLVDDVPVFRDAGIYGESPLTTTDPLGELQSTLFESKGEDFRDAVHNAVLKMRLYPHWRWLLKHIPPEGWTLKLARDPQGGKAG